MRVVRPVSSLVRTSRARPLLLVSTDVPVGLHALLAAEPALTASPAADAGRFAARELPARALARGPVAALGLQVDGLLVAPVDVVQRHVEPPFVFKPSVDARGSPVERGSGLDAGQHHLAPHVLEHRDVRHLPRRI